MLQILRLVSAFTSSLLASVRFVIALDVAVLLLWLNGEITYSIWKSEYQPLAILFAFTLIAVLGVTIWRSVKPEHFGQTVACTSSLNILSLLVLDVIVILAAVFISVQLQKPLTTPLLKFCQRMIHDVMG